MNRDKEDTVSKYTILFIAGFGMTLFAAFIPTLIGGEAVTIGGDVIILFFWMFGIVLAVYGAGAMNNKDVVKELEGIRPSREYYLSNDAEKLDRKIAELIDKYE